jgi:hypothetical protein
VAFEDADLHALHRLLRLGAGERSNQCGGGYTGKKDGRVHEEISG